MSPKVSIGIPVFNAELLIANAIDSVLKQGFEDFEVVISDNCSTDYTFAICQEYASKDPRIRLYHQDSNRGAAFNFQFVFEKSKGKYFMWNAADDLRTRDFLETHVSFLESHLDYVASTSPNCFEGQKEAPDQRVVFSLEGTREDRLCTFFDNCLKSQGIFYSLIRSDALRGCDVLGKSYLAADWAIIMFLLTRGCVNRTSDGLIVLGAYGISNSNDSLAAFRNDRIELVVPFFRLSQYCKGAFSGYSLAFKVRLAKWLVILNVKALYWRAFFLCYKVYCATLRGCFVRLRSKVFLFLGRGKKSTLQF